MSFNGSGVFSISTSGNPVVTGTVISSTWLNALTADLATGLSTCILKDGTQTATAVVPFVAGITAPVTALGNVQSGSYTPTVSATTNVGASTPRVTGYLRVGNQAQVSGMITIDPTATGLVLFEIDLPIASNIGAVSDLGGTTYEDQGAAAGYILGNVANNTAAFQYIAASASAQSVAFTFGYRVI